VIKTGLFELPLRREGISIGGYTAIADAGASLVKLLREHMAPDPIPRSDLIGIASPADKGDLALTLYL